MLSLGRFLIAVPMTAGAVWAAKTACEVIQVDAPVRESEAEIRTWVATGSRPEDGTWSSIKDRLVEAELTRPSAAVHELQGLLGSMGSDNPERISDGVNEFAKALHDRPVSPYSWANMARARYRLGTPGSNLELAFARAALLGPAEPGVQRLIADYGLAVWDEITPATKTVVDRVLAAGMRRNPLEMLQISDRRGRLDIACRHLADSSRKAGPQVNRLCPSWELTP